MGSTERKQQFVFVQIWKMVTIGQRQTSDEKDQNLVHPMDPMSNRGTGQDRDTKSLKGLHLSISIQQVSEFRSMEN